MPRIIVFEVSCKSVHCFCELYLTKSIQKELKVTVFIFHDKLDYAQGTPL